MNPDDVAIAGEEVELPQVVTSYIENAPANVRQSFVQWTSTRFEHVPERSEAYENLPYAKKLGLVETQKTAMAELVRVKEELLETKAENVRISQSKKALEERYMMLESQASELVSCRNKVAELNTSLEAETIEKNAWKQQANAMEAKAVSYENGLSQMNSRYNQLKLENDTKIKTLNKEIVQLRVENRSLEDEVEVLKNQLSVKEALGSVGGAEPAIPQFVGEIELGGVQQATRDKLVKAINDMANKHFQDALAQPTSEDKVIFIVTKINDLSTNLQALRTEMNALYSSKNQPREYDPAANLASYVSNLTRDVNIWTKTLQKREKALISALRNIGGQLSQPSSVAGSVEEVPNLVEAVVNFSRFYSDFVGKLRDFNRDVMRIGSRDLGVAQENVGNYSPIDWDVTKGNMDKVQRAFEDVKKEKPLLMRAAKQKYPYISRPRDDLSLPDFMRELTDIISSLPGVCLDQTDATKFLTMLGVSDMRTFSPSKFGTVTRVIGDLKKRFPTKSVPEIFEIIELVLLIKMRGETLEELIGEEAVSTEMDVDRLLAEMDTLTGGGGGVAMAMRPVGIYGDDVSISDQDSDDVSISDEDSDELMLGKAPRLELAGGGPPTKFDFLKKVSALIGQYIFEKKNDDMPNVEKLVQLVIKAMNLMLELEREGIAVPADVLLPLMLFVFPDGDMDKAYPGIDIYTGWFEYTNRRFNFNDKKDFEIYALFRNMMVAFITDLADTSKSTNQIKNAAYFTEQPWNLQTVLNGMVQGFYPGALAAGYIARLWDYLDDDELKDRLMRKFPDLKARIALSDLTYKKAVCGFGIPDSLLSALKKLKEALKRRDEVITDRTGDVDVIERTVKILEKYPKFDEIVTKIQVGRYLTTLNNVAVVLGVPQGENFEIVAANVKDRFNEFVKAFTESAMDISGSGTGIAEQEPGLPVDWGNTVNTLMAFFNSYRTMKGKQTLYTYTTYVQVENMLKTFGKEGATQVPVDTGKLLSDFEIGVREIWTDGIIKKMKTLVDVIGIKDQYSALDVDKKKTYLGFFGVVDEMLKLIMVHVNDGLVERIEHASNLIEWFGKVSEKTTYSTVPAKMRKTSDIATFTKEFDAIVYESNLGVPKFMSERFFSLLSDYRKLHPVQMDIDERAVPMEGFGIEQDPIMMEGNEMVNYLQSVTRAILDFIVMFTSEQLQKVPKTLFEKIGDIMNNLDAVDTEIGGINNDLATLRIVFGDLGVKIPESKNRNQIGPQLTELTAKIEEVHETKEKWDAYWGAKHGKKLKNDLKIYQGAGGNTIEEKPATVMADFQAVLIGFVNTVAEMIGYKRMATTAINLREFVFKLKESVVAWDAENKEADRATENIVQKIRILYPTMATSAFVWKKKLNDISEFLSANTTSATSDPVWGQRHAKQMKARLEQFSFLESPATKSVILLSPHEILDKFQERIFELLSDAAKIVGIKEPKGNVAKRISTFAERLETISAGRDDLELLYGQLASYIEETDSVMKSFVDETVVQEPFVVSTKITSVDLKRKINIMKTVLTSATQSLRLGARMDPIFRVANELPSYDPKIAARWDARDVRRSMEELTKVLNSAKQQGERFVFVLKEYVGLKPMETTGPTLTKSIKKILLDWQNTMRAMADREELCTKINYYAVSVKNDLRSLEQEFGGQVYKMKPLVSEEVEEVSEVTVTQYFGKMPNLQKEVGDWWVTVEKDLKEIATNLIPNRPEPVQSEELLAKEVAGLVEEIKTESLKIKEFASLFGLTDEELKSAAGKLAEFNLPADRLMLLRRFLDMSMQTLSQMIPALGFKDFTWIVEKFGKNIQESNLLYLLLRRDVYNTQFFAARRLARQLDQSSAKYPLGILIDAATTLVKGDKKRPLGDQPEQPEQPREYVGPQRKKVAKPIGANPAGDEPTGMELENQ